MDPWIVTPVERARHAEQFKSLGPIAGFVTGEQAKGFLLQSQLPPAILGQIWGLADMNCDGKMDINEFSVACKLITMKLKGFEVPPALPPSLKNVLSGTTTPILSPTNTGILSPVPQMMPIRPIVPVPQSSVVPLAGSGMLMGGSTPPLLPSTVPQVPQPIMMSATGMYSSTMSTTPHPTTLPLGYDPNAMMQPQQTIAQVQGMSAIPSQSRSMSITSQESIVSPLMEWAVPNPSRLKYTQLFNQNDRSKSGFLSGVQARNILMGTGLPQQILATVWALSDLDADGRLSCEEFILSMHLCDVARQTGRLPPKLPADLIPPSFRSGGSRKQSIKSGTGSIVQSGHNTGSNTPTSMIDPEPLLSPGGTSFEDKRKMNYDKGQAELDRRRRVLEEAAARERDERERKEREEFEKREKQRLEQERRKQEEIERQIAMQREMEERRIEELRKAEEQKEAARKEMERQRRVEMEENKRLELLARRQKEQDEVLRLKGVNHGLGLELSQLTEKVKELSGKITETRVGVSTVKSEIDGMRAKRDGFMSESGTLKNQLKEQNARMLHAAQEKTRLERLAAESEVKHISLKQLREKLKNMKEELAKKQGDSDVAVSELNELKSTLSTVIESCKSIYEEYQDKREKVIAMRKKHNAEFDYNVAWGAPVRAGSFHEQEPESPFKDDAFAPLGTGVGEGSAYYRALYDFEARNADELGFVAGAIIQRDDSVVPDPGWLAGILDGKSGWFPESFVENISTEEAEITSFPTGPVAQASVDSQQYNQSAGEYYVAMYPYTSSEPGDLPFDAGEIILVSQTEGEWWTGSIGQDRSGIFPANYVAKQSDVGVEEQGNNVIEDVLAPINNFTADFPAFEAMGSKTELEPFEEAEIKREIFELAKGPPKSPKTVKTKKYEIATVLANYQGNGTGQLTLTRGQLITVRKKSASGWWEGELQAKGKKRELGWFPGSYVKILGPGGGSRQSSSRTTPIPFDDLIMPTTIAPVYADFSKSEQMIALYPYTAMNSDELTFVKDDIITIISKDEPDWWRGQLGTAIGLFPVNYVQPIEGEQNSQWSDTTGGRFGSNGNGGPSTYDEDDEWDEDSNGVGGAGAGDNGSFSGSDFVSTPQPEYRDTTKSEYYFEQRQPVEPTFDLGGIRFSSYSVDMSFGPEETLRQEAIKELLKTEQNYINDMVNVRKYFKDPIREARILTSDDLCTIFVNWDELVDCSFKLLKAFKIRTGQSENKAVFIVGDILCQHMPAMKVYIRFCSAQLRSAAFLQQKTETNSDFRELTKRLQGNPATQNLPLSSFLIKPMQRITRYPLLIKKILEHTPDSHPDRQNLEEALAKAEELCAQVNEGVREKENSDRLEWMQNHINCIGLEERLIFNSTTNSLGPRKFLHHGILKKTKSGKELLGFLFNDFLLLAQPSKILNQTQFSFDRNRDHKFKIYRKPLFLNEISVDDEGLTEAEFTIKSEKKTNQLIVAATGSTEKRLWIKSISEAQKSYHRVQQQYLQRQQSKKVKGGVGRLLVTVMDASCLSCKDRSGKSDPYCEVSLGSEVKQTRVINGTLNPRWNDSMQFSVKDLNQDILSFTVYDKDYFSPDQFLGRTEIRISSIYEQTRNQKMPWTKTFPLLEIESGEITIKLHLQIFEK